MKPKFLPVSLGALLAGLIFTAQANADIYLTDGNLLVNGGFNALGFPYPGNFGTVVAPWGWSGQLGYTWANNVVPVGLGVTLDAGGMVGFGSDGLIYQDVATVPGQVYQLTITAFSRAAPPGTSLQPLWNGIALSPGLADYQVWTALTYDVQASGNSTRVTVTTYASQAPTWIDSVSLVAIPEPAAWGLLSLGLVVYYRKWCIRSRRTRAEP